MRKAPPISAEVAEERILLQKDWSRYKIKERRNDLKMLDDICYSQQRALDELKIESEELYREAIQVIKKNKNSPFWRSFLKSWKSFQIDLSLIPVTVVGPTHTPAIDNYDSPDGEYADVTKKFEGE